VHVSDVRHIEKHRAESLIADPSPFKVETAITELKKYKSLGSDQIPTEEIQTVGEMLLCEIHKLILFGIGGIA
jgi:hypothetical protein